MKQYKRVFAALDGASTQEEVAQRAIQIAALNHAELMLGHVIDSVPDSLTGTDYQELAQTIQSRLEDSLGDILKDARNNPDIPSIEVVVKVGRIQETILRGKAPRGSYVKSRQGNDFPYLLFYFLHGIPKILFFIPKISAESQINFCHYLSKISIASP